MRVEMVLLARGVRRRIYFVFLSNIRSVASRDDPPTFPPAAVVPVECHMILVPSVVPPETAL